MAWLEKDTRTGLYKVAVRLSDGKLKRSLRTTNRREADLVRGTVENTLIAIERGWLNVPEGVDVGDFLISGGKAGAPPTVSRQIGLAELFSDYFLPVQNPHANWFERALSLQALSRQQHRGFATRAAEADRSAES